MTRFHHGNLIFALVFFVWSFQVHSADDLSMPISVSPDGHFLLTPKGEPFFWLADTAWELLHRLNREEADVYLRDRAAKGFTVIQVVATGKVDLIGLDAPNRYGELPFNGRNPAEPNPRFFEFADWLVDRAAVHGLRVALLPAWGQSFVSGGKYAVFTAQNAMSYGRWLGQRYRNKGIIWVLGGDVMPISPERSGEEQAHMALTDYRPVYDAMAEGIAQGAGQDPFITYHPTALSWLGIALPRTSLFFANRRWLDMNMIQSGAFQSGPGANGGGDILPLRNYRYVWNGTFNYLPIADEYRSSPVRPVVDAEPAYEDSPMWGPEIQDIGVWRAHHARAALYHSLFAGAAGHTYGHFSIWDFYDPRRVGQQIEGSYDRTFAKYGRAPWLKALDAPGAGQMRHAKALMLSRPYFARVPDQSIILDSAGEGERHIGAVRARDGSYIMIYVPDGRPVSVDVTKIAGSSAVGWWFDPRTGKASRIPNEAPTNQARSFTPPTRGSGQDWVLVLDDASKGFGTPGELAP